MRRLIFAAALIAFAATPGAAGAADHYASSSSTRASGDCPISTPCTLQRANTVAAAGDTVHVGSGTYTLTQPFTVRGGILFTGGAPGTERPVIKGYGVIVPSSGDPGKVGRIEHLELIGLRLDSSTVGSDLVVRGNTTAVQMGSGTLRNSLVTAAAPSGVGIVANYGSPVVVNTTVVAPGQDAAAIRASGSSRNDEEPEGVFNCMVSDAHIRLHNVIARGGGADLSARGQDVPECEAGRGSITVDHSNFRTKSLDAFGSITEGQGNQTSVPLTDDAAVFADATLYRQKTDSPTRDAGAAHDLVTGLDLDGEARVQEASVDIGADEVPAPPQAVTEAAAAVGQSAATLRATVTPNASETRVVFEYGTTTAYGSRTAEQVLAPGGPPAAVEAKLDGLAPGTEFHYRVLAYNTGGAQPRTGTGADVLFATTTAAPAPPAVAPVLPDVLSRLTASRSLTIRRYRSRGLRVGFVLGRAGTAYDARLTARMVVRGKRRTVTLGRVRGTAGPGARTLTLKPSRKTAKLLRRLRRVRARLTVTAKPPAAARVGLSRSVTLKR